jgi:putative methylase
MQKRLTRKLDLEIMLSRVKPHPTPKPSLEQYTVSVNVAAEMLYLAAYTYNSIVDKSVLDLGCGTGRLTLGAAFLGAKRVVGVDIDRAALRVAVENCINLGLNDKVQWVLADLDAITGDFDTVLENPPFGVQNRGADRRFIKKALTMGKTVYSIHKGSSDHPQSASARIQKRVGSQSTTRTFLRGFIDKNGGTIRAIYPMVMTIPHMFSFHRKMKHESSVDLYVIEGKKTKPTMTC